MEVKLPTFTDLDTTRSETFMEFAGVEQEHSAIAHNNDKINIFILQQFLSFLATMNTL